VASQVPEQVPNETKFISLGAWCANFKGFLHDSNLLNRGVTIEVTKHHTEKNGLRMRSAAQEVLQNGNRIEMEDQF